MVIFLYLLFKCLHIWGCPHVWSLPLMRFCQTVPRLLVGADHMVYLLHQQCFQLWPWRVSSTPEEFTQKKNVQNLSTLHDTITTDMLLLLCHKNQTNCLHCFVTKTKPKLLSFLSQHAIAKRQQVLKQNWPLHPCICPWDRVTGGKPGWLLWTLYSQCRSETHGKRLISCDIFSGKHQCKLQGQVKCLCNTLSIWMLPQTILLSAM